MVATHFGREKNRSSLTIADPGERRPVGLLLIAQIHNVLDARLSG
jgi:hypothetical protein